MNISTNVAKYYDRSHCRHIDMQTDGCELRDWSEQHGKVSFARHPDGFLVFLPPNEVNASDEYIESDPYSVETGITGDFHKRRVECTLQMVREAAKRTHEPHKILDLGCGQGHITSLIQQELPAAEVSGVDYSISAIEYANKHFRNIEFIVGNAYACPYSTGYFDIVVCNNLWEHVPDPLSLLAGIATIMKPGGCLIISTPSRYRWGNLVNVLRGKPVEFMSQHHVTEYTVGQVIEQLRYGDFEVIKCFSRPFKSGNSTFEVAKYLFCLFVSLTGSHHQLESTVFYLAQRTAKNGEDDKR